MTLLASSGVPTEATQNNVLYVTHDLVFYCQEKDDLLPLFLGSIIIYFSIAPTHKIVKWATPNCSRPQPATDNGAIGVRAND